MLLVKHDNFNDIKNVFDVLILKWLTSLILR